MSFKAFAVKDGENHWVLPKTHGMKVEAHAFFSEELFRLSEEGMWRQLAQAASYDGVIGAYAMPDAHVGFGVPVGTVIVTDETIIQAGSGYDISCGVIYLHAKDLDAEKVASWEARERWVSEVDLRVATGVGSKRPPKMKKFQERDVEKILRYGAKAIGVSADVCERQFIPIPETSDLKAIERARDKVLPQLGSVGGGNHFIEMQVDRDSGEVWVMVHCGSRGYGWQTANHFFFEGARLRGLPKSKREESWLVRERAARQRVLGAPQQRRELRGREPPHHRGGRQRRARSGLRRARRGVLRDFAQPRSRGDARSPRRNDEARLRPPQGRDARVPGGSPRSRSARSGRRRDTRV